MLLRSRVLISIGLAAAIFGGCRSAQRPEPEAVRIDAVLDELHAAASAADGTRYFRLFAPGAVFLGTDASERWPLETFRAYAEARFSTGGGWTYELVERHIDVAPDGRAAWFDELLDNDRYGRCRGTGVLLLTADGWRIAQYHLTIPIPNEMAVEVAGRIRQAAPP
jgi:hypothetical protein